MSSEQGDEASIAERYRRFARLEARGRSPIYEQIAQGLAGDNELLERVASLPPGKRQPNLLLAAVQYVSGPPEDFASFKRSAIEHWGACSSVVASRSTQTNEVARCATLLPVIASLAQPVALLELGASAGLCLLMDHYRYEYGGTSVGREDALVVLRCELRGEGIEVPATMPEIVWRAGIDLHPIDLGDEREVRWLEALVWPGEGDRLERLRAAIALGRRRPPRVERADLRSGVRQLVGRAPKGTTLVVFHSAVLTYASPSERAAFEAEMLGLGVEWIANEGAVVLPSVQARLEEAERADHRGHLQYVVSHNGIPLAWADPHGTWMVGRGSV